MSKNVAKTIGSTEFDHDGFLEAWKADFVPNGETNDLKSCIEQAFKLIKNDNYVYHAIASVTLQQVQAAINAGGRNGMHAWYRDGKGQQIEPPSKADIEAYIQIFSSKTTTSNAINSFASNAKQKSLRFSIGQHLQSQLLLPSSASCGLVMPAKQKNPKTYFVNPYYDIWAWSCVNLEWAGPTPETAQTRQSHHILPILYHHFGCIVPTWDAISLLTQLVGSSSSSSSSSKKKQHGNDETNQKRKPRCILEIGSGNGYWTYLLRRHRLTVIAVDNALSDWRTLWISDTIIADGVAFLQNPSSTLTSSSSLSASSSSLLGGPGCPTAILLLVYPQVSHDLTARLIRAYTGDVIVVAGTQNANGYTAFANETIAAWMQREMVGASSFRLVVQVPLPSFAGKDEALFVFVRV